MTGFSLSVVLSGPDERLEAFRKALGSSEREQLTEEY